MPDDASDLFSLVRRELETWLAPDDSSLEARLLRKWERKRRSVRSHARSFVVVNGFLFLLWLMLGVSTGAWFPWFAFPLIGWGMGFTMQALGYRAWVSEHAGELQRARERLGLTPPAPGESSWDRLETRCRKAIAEARAALETRSEPVDAAVLRARLDDAERQLVHLLEGARAIDQTLGEVSPGGVSSVDRAIAEVDRRRTETAAPETKSVLEQKRALLQSRRAKVAALSEERARVETTVEGFLLAAENVRLDVLRLGRAPADRSEVEGAVQRLQEELDLLQKVHRELSEL